MRRQQQRGCLNRLVIQLTQRRVSSADDKGGYLTLANQHLNVRSALGKPRIVFEKGEDCTSIELGAWVKVVIIDSKDIAYGRDYKIPLKGDGNWEIFISGAEKRNGKLDDYVRGNLNTLIDRLKLKDTQSLTALPVMSKLSKPLPAVPKVKIVHSKEDLLLERITKGLAVLGKRVNIDSVRLNTRTVK